ncbi:hypothetical protein [Roseiconus lacunae]|uniref:Uncharacterized protein n=1 Tax=Roseiconus lacunae TaxID=2605694 RepID=A0ABT7PH62_9BACT|nr:hypothetical protein [Roseiconus lacunae]MDM4015827.1 hypothetical protein [Roseiconus lacunae]
MVDFFARARANPAVLPVTRIAHGDNLRYRLSHLLIITTFATPLFATLQLSQEFSTVLVIVFGCSLFHVLLASQLKCYKIVLPGVAAAFLTAVCFLNEMHGLTWFGFDFRSIVCNSLVCDGMRRWAGAKALRSSASTGWSLLKHGRAETAIYQRKKKVEQRNAGDDRNPSYPFAYSPSRRSP